MQTSTSIGKNITTARKKMNFTQAHLATQLAISPQAVGKWERGESMPDITTLKKLSEVLQEELNYFLTGEQKIFSEINEIQVQKETSSPNSSEANVKANWNWDMSEGNWSDADFSGLKNLKEQFSSSNVKNCLFKHSDLSGLVLAKNNIEACDFSGSDLRNSKLQSSNLLKCKFIASSFIDASFYKSNVERCDFFQANLSGTEIIETNFEHCNLHDVTWQYTMFKKSNISHAVFSGKIENCHFEHVGFYHIVFEHATLRNTFFKYNEKFKKVKFVNCQVDSITFAFLKNNQATMTGITLIP